MMIETPFIDIISIKYFETVKNMYAYLISKVEDPSKLSMYETYPFFQFVGYSTVIKYDDHIIVKISESVEQCIPIHKTVYNGLSYVSYNNLVMHILVQKFHSHLEKNKKNYMNYGSALSNIIRVRNIFLEANNLGIINDTIYNEFPICCVGQIIDSQRSSRLKRQEKYEKGLLVVYKYEPEKFFKLDSSVQANILAAKFRFKNSSGNIIKSSYNLRFKINDEQQVVLNEKIMESDTEEEDEPDIDVELLKKNSMIDSSENEESEDD
jgi:hypothetical protein